ncbi:MAG TPA: hypothetical protein VKP69_27685 [Isosphaeraceae bacterium]|nr:hypothetical protein [Isosphaeraceae bacterium]
MRCTRCDRWAVPQAVARTPDDIVVFGWCLDCLRETGCTEVEVADRVRGTRLPALPEMGRAPRHEPDRSGERRTRIVALVTALLAAWGMVLLSAGGRLLRRPPEGPASPFGNGTPVLLLVGGGTTTATALVLGMTAFGRVLLRSLTAPRAVR